MMINKEVFSSIDKVIINASRKIRPYYHIEPQNISLEEFLKNKKNPVFKYRDLEFDPEQVASELRSLEIPDNSLGRLYEGKRQELLSQIEIIKNRGSSDVKEISKKIYGSPNDKLIDYALDILINYKNIDSERNVPSSVIKEGLEQALKDFGLNNWSVELSDKWLTTVYAEDSKITVCKNRFFKKSDINRFRVHEVGVHAVRAANGHEQDFKIFVIGTPEYLQTEEGMAMYFEEKTGNLDNELLRDYAGRVFSVYSVIKGYDFRDCFEWLKGFGFSDEQAWRLTIRAYRGGGFVKDHIYLKGYLEVKDFGNKENIFAFKTLFAGKFGIKEFPLIRDLMKKNIVKPARFIPYFI